MLEAAARRVPVRSLPCRACAARRSSPRSAPPRASRETLVRMVEAGMDVARLNYSHGTLDEHAETVRRVRDAAGRAGRPVAILQDLPGPKLRIGPLRDDVVELTPGERLTFECGDERDRRATRTRMCISWAGLPDAVEPDSILYLADGSVRLRVVEVRAGRARGRRRDRGRRRGRLAPGAEHPRPGRRAAGGARGGPRPAAPRRVDRRRHGRAVLRADAPRTSNTCASTRACR